MWRLCTRVAKRERNTVRLFNNNKGTLQKNHQYGCFNLSNCHFSSTNIVYNDSDGRGTPTVSSPPDVALQLDYYMSLQFAGVACALVNDTYKSKGINNLHILPTCSVGTEAFNVRKYQNENPSTLATFGVVEQNVFIPTLFKEHKELQVTGVASMFRKSPLCVVSLEKLKDDDVIGVHEDTVELVQRIFPNQKVIASPRGTKNHDLLNGRYDGIQAYTTTEVPALYRYMESKGLDPDELHVQVLEDHFGDDGPAQLGYSQMIFVINEALDTSPSNSDRRQAAQAFLEGTFTGWKYAIRNPNEAIEAVLEACRMLQLDDEKNDHWYRSKDFMVDMLEATNDHVKETFVGDRLGVLSPKRWTKANEWLLHDKDTKSIDTSTFGLDQTGLWTPPSNLLHGNELGREILHDAKMSAVKFEQRYGRKPSLAVINVGELSRYTDAKRRMQLYSNPSNSWFSKTKMGIANNFDVKEINLDAKGLTTEILLSEIYNIRDDVDGVQIMWPFPDDIDEAAVFNAVPLSKDVDGIHYTSWGSKYPPVTPAGVLELMKEHDVSVRGKHILVVGRSPIVGTPLSMMLREAGALVSMAHTDVGHLLEDAVGQADIVVTAAGSPGTIDASWIKDGAVVINVGTTFCEKTDGLLSDVSGDIVGARFSPVPGGCGPTSAPMLFRNVSKAAWDQMEDERSSSSWEKEPAKLRKSYHFDSYTEALKFAQKVDEISTIMDHHANITIVHKCVNGVDMQLTLFSFEANELTQKDYAAANAIDFIHHGNPINMSDYSYVLKQESIAVHPAEPRGSSKLLRVDGNGKVSYYDHFGKIPDLLDGCHVVFNNSRVLDARLSVKLANGTEVELMLLDLGNIDPASPCNNNTIQAMIRSDSVAKGDVYSEPVSGSKVEVVDIRGVWEEDEEGGGNGCDCIVRIDSEDNLGTFLSMNGSIPIPPYLHREAVLSDKERYQNVYCEDEGSVAAPTAGLHFTDEVLDKLDSTSSLTLHVGAGTFMPVLSKDAKEHSMHAEHFFVKVIELREIIQALKAGKPLAVVGTTSSRTLESLYWLGLKRIRGLPNNEELMLGQFEWISLAVADPSTTPVSALSALIDGLPDHEIISGKTSLMITPNSYKFKVVDHLVTNFHAPDSTLMLLVSAFLGKQNNVTKIYEDAQRKGYRFLSYGDSCLFSRPGIDLPGDRNEV